MNAKELNMLLIENFPELKDAYQDEISWQEGDETGSHVVYGDVFTPYLKVMVDEQREEKLERLFGFIESILLKKEMYSTEVIMFSVLERIVCDMEDFQFNCKKYFGEKTASAVDELLLHK